jgi:hypothetical protein
MLTSSPIYFNVSDVDYFYSASTILDIFISHSARLAYFSSLFTRFSINYLHCLLYLANILTNLFRTTGFKILLKNNVY